MYNTGRSSIQHKYTYQILIKATESESEDNNFTELHNLQTVLRAMQAYDPSTSLIMAADEAHHQRTYTNINPKSKKTKQNTAKSKTF
jgi:hypothetical protein